MNNKNIQIYGIKKEKNEVPKRKDVIITKYEKKITYNDEGDMILKQIPIKVNITQKVNETAKLVKEQTASEKLAELEKIFTK